MGLGWGSNILFCEGLLSMPYLPQGRSIARYLAVCYRPSGNGRGCCWRCSRSKSARRRRPGFASHNPLRSGCRGCSCGLAIPRQWRCPSWWWHETTPSAHTPLAPAFAHTLAMNRPGRGAIVIGAWVRWVVIGYKVSIACRPKKLTYGAQKIYTRRKYTYNVYTYAVYVI